MSRATTMEAPPGLPTEEDSTNTVTIEAYGGNVKPPTKTREQIAIAWRRAARLATDKILQKENNKTRSQVGTGATLSGNSLGALDEDNQFRISVFHSVYSQTFEYVLLGVVISHLIVITLLSGDSSRGSGSAADDGVLKAFDYIFTGFYTIEAVLRIVAVGFIGGKDAYLKLGYNQADFLFILVSWIFIVWDALEPDQQFRVLVLRVFRSMLVVKDFKFAASIIAIMEALKESMPLLVDVIGFTAVVATFYGLMGISLFGGSLKRRCVLNTEFAQVDEPEKGLLVVSEPELFCGSTDPESTKGFQCPNVNMVDSCPDQTLEWTGNCTAIGPGLVCSDVLANPSFGRVNFDNFLYALLTMFQILTMEDWNTVLYSMIDAEYKPSAVYFITLIIIGTFFLVNIFVAAISGVFLRLRKEHQELLELKSISDRNNPRAGLESQSLLMRLTANLSNRASAAEGASRLSAASGDKGKSMIQVLTAAIKGQDPSVRPYDPDGPPLKEGVEQAVQTPALVLKMRAVVDSKAFRNVTNVLIFLCAAIMCMWQDDQSASTRDSIIAVERVFVMIFVLETVLRVVAAGGFFAYFRSTSDLVDFLTILYCVVAIMSGLLPNLASARMLRWFASDKSQDKDHQSMLTKVLRGSMTMLSLFLFFFIILYVFAVIGMQLFGARFNDEEDGRPRENFDTLPAAMLTMFTISTAENWTTIQYMGMKTSEVYAPIFCWIYFILTNYVILNLIIAVVLEELELGEGMKKQLQKQEIITRLKNKPVSTNTIVDSIERTRARLMCWVTCKPYSREAGSERSRRLKELHGRQDELKREIDSNMAETDGNSEAEKVLKAEADKKMKAFEVTDVSVPAASDPAAGPEAKPKRKQRDSALRRRSLVTTQAFKAEEPKDDDGGVDDVLRKTMYVDAQLAKGVQSEYLEGWMANNALGIFPAGHWLREKAHMLHTNKYYVWTTNAVILLSLLACLYTEPVGEENPHETLVSLGHLLVFFTFLLDLLIKSADSGFAFTPHAYLTVSWNVIDFLMLILDFAVLLPWSDYWQRAFQMGIAFRPIRILNRNEPMQVLTTSLVKTFPSIIKVFALGAVIFIIFGQLGVRLFAGTYYACNDGSIEREEECFGTFINDNGMLYPRNWEKPNYNFDNIGKAVLTLFEVASLDAWLDIMYKAMDRTPSDEQPQRNNAPAAALYFVIFICFGSFFIVRTFIGVFIDQFSLISGSKLLTERQKLWRDMHRIVLSMRPQAALLRPANKVRARCYDTIMSKRFRPFMCVVVLLNLVVLALKYEDEPEGWTLAIDAIDFLFVLVYIWEVAVKLLAMPFKVWRKSWWNIFEAVIAGGSFLTIFPQEDGPRLVLGRPFRFLRVFRLVRYVDSLKVLVDTIMVSLPSLLSIVGLLLLLIFIYSGIGTQLFADVRYGQALSHTTNFDSFLNSFILLFQVMTGEGWRALMNDCKNELPLCTKTDSFSDCGFPLGATAYFVSFVMLCTYILQNLFVAAILDNITFGLLNEKSLIAPSHLVHFQQVWMQMDPLAKGFLGQHKLRELVSKLDEPLGMREPSRKWFKPIYYEMCTFHQEGGIQFTDILESLLAHKLGTDALTLDLRVLREKELERIMDIGSTIEAQALVRGFLARLKVSRLRHAKQQQQ